MTKRSFIVLLTAACLGAAPGAGIAAPGAARAPAGGAPTGGADRTPDANAPDRADTFEITMRAGKGRLGMAVLQISPELRAHFGAPNDRGVLVDAVKPDSPAARAGVQVGDVIVEVDGEAATSAADVLDAIGDRKQGEAVAIAVMRGGQRLELRAVLEDDAAPAWRGMRPAAGATGLDPALRRWFEDIPSFYGLGGGFERGSRRSLEDARKRLDELERRLERLEDADRP